MNVCEGVAIDVNDTSDVWVVEDRVTGQVTAAFLLLILVVGLPWNLLVVLTIVKEKLYHQPTIVLLLNLILNDSIFLVFTVSEIVAGIAGEFMPGLSDNTRCKLCRIGMIEFQFIMMSLYSVALLAFDRFLYIYRPLRYTMLVTSCRLFLVLLFIWIIVFVAAFLPYIKQGDIIFSSAFLFCIPVFSNLDVYLDIFIVVMCVIPIIGIVVFNVWVVVIVQKNIRAIYNVRRAQESGSQRDSRQNSLCKKVKRQRNQKQLHLIRVFAALLGSNLLSWLPVLCLWPYLLVVMEDNFTQLVAATNVMFVSQVMVHPILETVLIKDVREPLKRSVCRCLGKGRRGEGVWPDSSGKSWSCNSSRLRCCGEFVSVLQAAMVEDSGQTNSDEQGDSRRNASETNLSTISPVVNTVS